MASNRHYEFGQQSYLLRQYPYRGRGALIDWLTREHGIVRTVYYPSRRRRARRGLPQVGRRWALDWRARRTGAELVGLVDLNPASAYSTNALSAMQTLMNFSYINELILQFFKPRDAHPELFDLYTFVSETMDGYNAEVLLRYFETHLLRIAGYSLSEKQLGRASPSPSSSDPWKGLDVCGEELVAVSACLRQLHGCSLHLQVDQKNEITDYFGVISREFAELNREQKYILRHQIRSCIGAQIDFQASKSRVFAKQVRMLKSAN